MRTHQPARPPEPARRHDPVAESNPPHSIPRRGLRRHRLLRRRRIARQPRRLRGVHGRVRRARHPRHARPRPQPHQRRAPVVPRRSHRPPVALPRLVRVGGRGAARPPGGDGLPWGPGGDVDLRRDGWCLVPPSLLSVPTGPQLAEPAGALGDEEGGDLLGAVGRQRLSARWGPVPHREDRAGGRRAATGLRLPRRAARAAVVVTWGRGVPRGGTRPLGPARRVLRRRGRGGQPGAHALRVPHQRGTDGRTRASGRPSPGGCLEGPPLATAQRLVGNVPAKPRRGGPVPADRGRAQRRFRRVRPRAGPSAL